jgi:exopolysaccharide biosynthesis polyprenyl glycosylphosphotransferase
MKWLLHRHSRDARPLAGCHSGIAFGGLRMFVDKIHSGEGLGDSSGGSGTAIAVVPNSRVAGPPLAATAPGELPMVEGEHRSIAVQTERSDRFIDPRPHRSAARVWRRRYRLRLVGVDVIGVMAGLALAALLGRAPFEVPVAAGAGWLVAATLYRNYSDDVLESRRDQFIRIARTFAVTVGILAVAAWVLSWRVAPAALLFQLSLTSTLATIGRYLLARAMRRRRIKCRASKRVLVAAPSRVGATLVRAIGAAPQSGLHVVGVCLPGNESDQPSDALDTLNVRVVGELTDILDAVAGLDAEMVIVSSGAEMPPERLRWLAWQLEGSGVELVVAPGVIEASDQRLSVRTVAGVPLVGLAQPRYDGAARWVKNAAERAVALVAVMLLSPLFVTIAALIRATSSGPAVFTQTRVGRDGRRFTIYKFRSMAVDAESQLADLADVNEAADGLLFKIREDPRVTKVGAILRKYSLDELPQLFNVVLGSMSLVGPRPPLPTEVDQYSDEVSRRLLVKPGLTGLWQVSGRSDLSWDESVRLDLRYIENWTIAGDLKILAKTFGAVAGASGSY